MLKRLVHIQFIINKHPLSPEGMCLHSCAIQLIFFWNIVLVSEILVFDFLLVIRLFEIRFFCIIRVGGLVDGDNLPSSIFLKFKYVVK